MMSMPATLTWQAYHSTQLLPCAQLLLSLALFLVATLLSQGGFQYYLYNHLFVRWCSGITAALGHKGSAPIKTFIDQAIQ
jgi:hypothetical protein